MILDGTQVSALETTIDLFLRLPADSIRSYEALVPTNPIFYKACTSAVAYTVGDFVSQVRRFWFESRVRVAVEVEVVVDKW